MNSAYQAGWTNNPLYPNSESESLCARVEVTISVLNFKVSVLASVKLKTFYQIILLGSIRVVWNCSNKNSFLVKTALIHFKMNFLYKWNSLYSAQWLDSQWINAKSKQFSEIRFKKLPSKKVPIIFWTNIRLS